LRAAWAGIGAGSVQGFRIGPGGKIGDEVELPEQLAHDFAGVLALAELLDTRQDAPERFFSLRDGVLRVELALLLEAAVMLDEFFAEKVG
jgi:hypothetical protein